MAEVDLGMNLYEFNKQGMKVYDPLDRIALGVKVSDMAKEIFAREGSLKYWMLLNNEMKDYTLFHFNNRDNKNQFQKDFIETILNRGVDVTEIELQPDGAYEVWVRDKKTGEDRLYMFFNYEWGVVEIG